MFFCKEGFPEHADFILKNSQHWRSECPCALRTVRGARNPQWGDRVPALIEKHWSKKLPGSRIDVLQLGGIGVKPLKLGRALLKL